MNLREPLMLAKNRLRRRRIGVERSLEESSAVGGGMRHTVELVVVVVVVAVTVGVFAAAAADRKWNRWMIDYQPASRVI